MGAFSPFRGGELFLRLLPLLLPNPLLNPNFDYGMEEPEYFNTGFFCAGNQHCAPEKKARGGGNKFAVEDLIDLSNKAEDNDKDESDHLQER